MVSIACGTVEYDYGNSDTLDILYYSRSSVLRGTDLNIQKCIYGVLIGIVLRYCCLYACETNHWSGAKANTETGHVCSGPEKPRRSVRKGSDDYHLSG